MRTIKGISESFGHRLEWGAMGWDEHKAVKGICPALRATDYKIPKYVWYNVETD